MILPLVQDMLNMSAKSLWTSFPPTYDYLKVIAKEKWPHIKIQEKTFKTPTKGMRNYIGTKDTYWLITINKTLNHEEKYITLVHELIHCTIDEIKLLEPDEEEKIAKSIETEIRANFEKTIKT